jgi:hypothetical protein
MTSDGSCLGDGFRSKIEEKPLGDDGGGTDAVTDMGRWMEKNDAT